MERGGGRSWKLFSWPRVGVVDVGSNAIRLTVAEVSANEIREIGSHRFSLRLGKDVFNKRRTLGTQAQANLIEIFLEIKKIFVEYKVDLYRAVATSALRTARNRRRVLRRVLQRSGIEIELISGEEEGRLIGASFANKHFARQELLMDLGGGSLELAFYEKGKLRGLTSLPLGAVRLLEIMSKREFSSSFLCGHIAAVSERDSFFRGFVRRPPRNLYPVGSGGNIRALYRLRKRVLRKSCPRTPMLSLRDIAELTQIIEKMGVKEREKKLKLPKDRADVILPAAYVYHEMLTYLGANEIYIPMTVSLRRGTLLDLQKQLFA